MNRGWLIARSPFEECEGHYQDADLHDGDQKMLFRNRDTSSNGRNQLMHMGDDFLLAFTTKVLSLLINGSCSSCRRRLAKESARRRNIRVKLRDGEMGAYRFLL